MKLVVALLIVLGFMQISRGYVLNSPTMDEILENLQGNNHNVYLIFFVDSTSKDQQVIIATKDVEEALHILLRTYPQVYFTKLDISHKDFKKFSEKVEKLNCNICFHDSVIQIKNIWDKYQNELI